VTGERRQHVARVARLLADWATAMQVSDAERARWLRAAYLHDAMKDAPVRQLLEMTPAFDGPDNLRHGPAAAAMAERHGERDEGVLEAVRHHSTGSAAWDRVGRMLYLADYLEAGRRHRPPERDDWVRRVPDDPASVLREVAASRICYNLRRGWPLLPPTVEFWNGLVG
jgi:2-amino-4-hydroxy-6-hydroxymethyldihydropteridine diphosphokinase